MADTKLSGLSVAAAAADADLYYVSQSSTSLKQTHSALKTYTSASPTLVTPVLGVATGTSIALGGATIGSDALGITGTVTISGAVSVGNINVTAATQPANGIYLVSANTLGFSANTTNLFKMNSVILFGSITGSPVMYNRQATTTLPVLIPNGQDLTTGVGSATGTAGTVALIANSAAGLTVTNAGSTVLGTAAIATTATDGFLYAVSGAGTPTGVPTTFTGRVPIYVDTTNAQLWMYLGGGWKQPKTPAGAALVTWQ